MSICSMKELLKTATIDNRAVGAFNVGNMEMLIGAVKAAEELNTPIILQIAEARLPHSPLYLMGPMMLQAAKESKLDIAVHLDHGLTIDRVKQALSLGFSSIMFDGSRYDLPKNIQLTKEIISLAGKTGANVEAELGIVGGSEDGKSNHKTECTDPNIAKSFAKDTGVDALAVAIGNAHGHYMTTPKLQFAVLAEINKNVNIPLVLHGGTGITAADFRHCINLGVRKINIATASFDALTEKARQYFIQPAPHDYFHLNEAMVEGVYNNVKRHILIFNNAVPINRIK